jgi:hypothetical protein
MARIVTPARGKIATAIRVSTHSRLNMTTRSATMVPV